MQDNDNGYIQIPRAHPIWNLPASDFRVAVEIIRRATHKDITFRHLGTSFDLKRGQLFISVRTLARDCQIKRETLRRILSRLFCTHFCTHSCTHLGIVITVCDYEYFNNSTKTYAPTYVPTFAPRVGPQMAQSGSPNGHTNNNEQGKKNNQVTELNNKEKNYKEPSGKKPLTEQNFDRTEAPVLASLYPFRTSKDNCIQHLRNRGYIEAAISQILEWIYPVEYTGRKEAVKV